MRRTSMGGLGVYRSVFEADVVQAEGVMVTVSRAVVGVGLSLLLLLLLFSLLDLLAGSVAGRMKMTAGSGAWRGTGFDILIR